MIAHRGTRALQSDALVVEHLSALHTCYGAGIVLGLARWAFFDGAGTPSA